MAACSSTENKSSIPTKETPAQYSLYPPPVARYEDIKSSPKFFLDTLGKFHAAMGTKFKIPIVGGRDLDLHRLFVEVTSRGGIKKVLEEKKWREVTNCFTFPPSATNASFILRKYYMSLIHHFEQVYYFKAKAWTPISSDTWQSTQTTLTSTSGMSKTVLPLPEMQMNPTTFTSTSRMSKAVLPLPEIYMNPLKQPMSTVLPLPEIQMNSLKQPIGPSEEIQAMSVKRQRTITEQELLPKGSTESPIGLPVTGIIDGKFESGYLCTVRIGGEQLQGVLYQTGQTQSYGIPKPEGVVTEAPTMVRHRRRRRKKSEMKKRDPTHPKPNRSGYNFFFAEEHARLKLLHTGKDRAISRMIGEEWNKLTESEKAVYQEKAVKDKERYRSEMEHYREGIKKEQVLTNAMPLQQQNFMADTNMMSVGNTENNGENSHQTHENEPNSGSCEDENSSFKGEEITTGKEDFDLEMGAENVDIKMKPKEELLYNENKLSSNTEDNGKSCFLDGSVQKKSMSVQENELLIMEHESARVQVNELKQDGKTPDDEPRIPDINNENKTKSVDNKEQDLVKLDGMVEKRPVATSEENVEKSAQDGQSPYLLCGAE